MAINNSQKNTDYFLIYHKRSGEDELKLFIPAMVKLMRKSRIVEMANVNRIRNVWSKLFAVCLRLVGGSLILKSIGILRQQKLSSTNIFQKNRVF